MGTLEKRQEYIHRFARNLMGRFNIYPNASNKFKDDPSAEAIARKLARDFNPTFGKLGEIGRHINDLSIETQAKLAVCGIGVDYISGTAKIQSQGNLSLSQAAGKDWASEYDSGRLLLFKTAFFAVIAAIADNLWADLHKEPPLKCRFCNWKTARWRTIGDRRVSGFELLEGHVEDKHPDKEKQILDFSQPDAPTDERSLFLRS